MLLQSLSNSPESTISLACLLSATSGSSERWPSPARREPKQINLEGRRESAVAGQVHGRVSPPGLKDRYKP